MARSTTVIPFQHYASETTGSVPAPADMAEREIAANIEDKRLFTKTAAGSVVDLLEDKLSRYSAVRAAESGYSDGDACLDADGRTRLLRVGGDQTVVPIAINGGPADDWPFAETDQTYADTSSKAQSGAALKPVIDALQRIEWVRGARYQYLVTSNTANDVEGPLNPEILEDLDRGVLAAGDVVSTSSRRLQTDYAVTSAGVVHPEGSFGGNDYIVATGPAVSPDGGKIVSAGASFHLVGQFTDGVNLAQWNLTPRSSGDKAAQIQAAIDLLSHYQVLNLPAWNCRHDTELLVSKDIKIKGLGRNYSALVSAGGNNGIKLTTNLNGFTLEGLTVSCTPLYTTTPNTATGLWSDFGSDSDRHEGHRYKEVSFNGWELCVDLPFMWQGLFSSFRTRDVHSGIRLSGKQVLNRLIDGSSIWCDLTPGSIGLLIDGPEASEGFEVHDSLIGHAGTLVHSKACSNSKIVNSQLDFAGTYGVLLENIGSTLSTNWIIKNNYFGLNGYEDFGRICHAAVMNNGADWNATNWNVTKRQDIGNTISDNQMKVYSGSALIHGIKAIRGGTNKDFIKGNKIVGGDYITRLNTEPGVTQLSNELSREPLKIPLAHAVHDVLGTGRTIGSTANFTTENVENPYLSPGLRSSERYTITQTSGQWPGLGFTYAISTKQEYRFSAEAVVDNIGALNGNMIFSMALYNAGARVDYQIPSFYTGEFATYNGTTLMTYHVIAGGFVDPVEVYGHIDLTAAPDFDEITIGIHSSNGVASPYIFVNASEVMLVDGIAGSVIGDWKQPTSLIDNPPVYDDEAAAVTGGVASGRPYQTTTGELRVKL